MNGYRDGLAFQRDDIRIEPLQTHLQNPVQAVVTQHLAFEMVQGDGMATLVELTGYAAAAVRRVGETAGALAAGYVVCSLCAPGTLKMARFDPF